MNGKSIIAFLVLGVCLWYGSTGKDKKQNPNKQGLSKDSTGNKGLSGKDSVGVKSRGL
jgi:hypothetical protein